MQIELGKTAKDRITGFKGIVTGIVYYISGCHQALLTPPIDKDGKRRDGEWFDLQRLTVLKDKKIVLDNEAPGFDQTPPQR